MAAAAAFFLNLKMKCSYLKYRKRKTENSESVWKFGRSKKKNSPSPSIYSDSGRNIWCGKRTHHWTTVKSQSDLLNPWPPKKWIFFFQSSSLPFVLFLFCQTSPGQLKQNERWFEWAHYDNQFFLRSWMEHAAIEDLIRQYFRKQERDREKRERGTRHFGQDCYCYSNLFRCLLFSLFSGCLAWCPPANISYYFYNEKHWRKAKDAWKGKKAFPLGTWEKRKRVSLKRTRRHLWVRQSVAFEQRKEATITRRKRSGDESDKKDSCLHAQCGACHSHGAATRADLSLSPYHKQMK